MIYENILIPLNKILTISKLGNYHHGLYDCKFDYFTNYIDTS